MRERQEGGQRAFQESPPKELGKTTRRKLFLCLADELAGEHERRIDFLVEATTQAEATRQATEHLKREWSDEPDSETPAWMDDAIASFYAATIMLHNLRVRRITAREAIEHFTRS